MFSQWPMQCDTNSVPAPTVPESWKRNFKEDMKLAMDYLFELKEKLEKLHPECTRVVEKLMQQHRF